MEYEVIYIGQSAGYNIHDKIKVKNTQNINDIVWEINQKAKLQWTDLGLINGDINEMTFGTRLDGITFNTPILKVRKIKTIK
jgi:hypothetical protein